MSNTGGPAFPTGTGGNTPYSNGMTLRDYFAAKAMPLAYQYWMTDYYDPNAADAEIRSEETREGFNALMALIAESAYRMADAMLKEREQK